MLAAIKCALTLLSSAIALPLSLARSLVRLTELFARSGRSELEFDMGDQLNEFLEEFRKASSAKNDMKKAAQAAAAASEPDAAAEPMATDEPEDSAAAQEGMDDDQEGEAEDEAEAAAANGVEESEDMDEEPGEG